MRRLSITNKHYNLLGYNEKGLINALVYNVHRGPAFNTFEDWFDGRDRLVIQKLFDCDTRKTKVDWFKYGNKSKLKSYSEILIAIEETKEFKGRPIEEDLDFKENNRGIPIIQDDTITPLGTFKRMNSQGIITLHIDNLQIFFWTIIFELNCKRKYEFTKEKLEVLAKFCVNKTLFHEFFHYFTDVQSHITEKYFYNFHDEEALAVAFSRLLIGYEAKNNHPYISDFFELAYNYKKAGYKDWINYKSEEQFFLKLKDYICLNPDLIRKGVHFTPILEGLIYSIIEDPNVDIKII